MYIQLNYKGITKNYKKTSLCTANWWCLIKPIAILFLKTKNLKTILKNDIFNHINENYALYLIQNNYKEIIAYYVSQLPNDLQIKHYSRFLQSKLLKFKILI